MTVMAVEFNTDRWGERDAETSASDLAALLPVIDAPTRDIVNEWLARRSRPVFQLGEQQFEILRGELVDEAGEARHHPSGARQARS